MSSASFNMKLSCFPAYTPFLYRFSEKRCCVSSLQISAFTFVTNRQTSVETHGIQIFFCAFEMAYVYLLAWTRCKLVRQCADTRSSTKTVKHIPVFCTWILEWTICMEGEELWACEERLLYGICRFETSFWLDKPFTGSSLKTVGYSARL